MNALQIIEAILALAPAGITLTTDVLNLIKSIVAAQPAQEKLQGIVNALADHLKAK